MSVSKNSGDSSSVTPNESAGSGKKCSSKRSTLPPSTQCPTIEMDRFDEHFLPDPADSLGVTLDESPEFLDTDIHGVGGHEFAPAPGEESIYTDDPVRVYL